MLDCSNVRRLTERKGDESEFIPVFVYNRGLSGCGECVYVCADTSTQSPSTTENPGSLVPPDKPDFFLQLTASASDAQMFFVLSSSFSFGVTAIQIMASCPEFLRIQPLSCLLFFYCRFLNKIRQSENLLSFQISIPL